MPQAGVVTCPQCPTCPAAAAEAEVVAAARAKMLSKPLKNIIECSADAKDTSCRMGKKRYEALGQKGAPIALTHTHTSPHPRPALTPPSPRPHPTLTPPSPPAQERRFG